MHATRVKFDDALFIGQASEADAVFERIVLRPLDNLRGGIESVAAAL